MPTKVFILSLDTTRSATEKVVLRDLDDTAVLINPRYLEFVKEELHKHNEANVYQIPTGADKRIA